MIIITSPPRGMLRGFFSQIRLEQFRSLSLKQYNKNKLPTKGRILKVWLRTNYNENKIVKIHHAFHFLTERCSGDRTNNGGSVSNKTTIGTRTHNAETPRKRRTVTARRQWA